MKAPVLVITFNRPDYTQKVLEAVRAYRPEKVFVFQDGARFGNDEDVNRCAAVREVVEKLIDWPCQFEKYYANENLGCGPGPAEALTWYFSQVESGIILEDDAIPHPDFFEYAAELLERYKDDHDVRAIGSMNVDTQKWGDGSYYFSMMNRNLCAWASWRRAWTAFDIRLQSTSRIQLSKALKKYGCGLLEREYWCDRLNEVHKDGIGGSSWDMQFFMSIWLNNGKGIIPNVNLSSNIGTVSDATHTLYEGNIIDNVPTSPIMPLEHPTSQDIQYSADKSFHFRYFEDGRGDWDRKKIIYYLINKRLKKIIGHTGPWRKRK